MLICLILIACQYVFPTQSYKQNKLLMRRKWHVAIGQILHYIMAPNDNLNSILYNSFLKLDINMQFSLKCIQLTAVLC